MVTGVIMVAWDWIREGRERRRQGSFVLTSVKHKQEALLWYYCKKLTLSWLKLGHNRKGFHGNASSWPFSNENTCISWWGLHLHEPYAGLTEPFSFPCCRGSHPLSYPAYCFPVFMCCLPGDFAVRSHLTWTPITLVTPSDLSLLSLLHHPLPCPADSVALWHLFLCAGPPGLSFASFCSIVRLQNIVTLVNITVKTLNA